MKLEYILISVVGIFLGGLVVFLVILYKPVFPFNQNQSLKKTVSGAVSSDTDSINDLKSKIRFLEKNISDLSSRQNTQTKELEEIKTAVSSQSAQPTQTPGKSIMAVASTKGGSFTTTSANYSPMGMYVNVNCQKSCFLWINFYSSSKNIGTTASAMGNLNTYDIFLDNVDQSIFSQANYPVDSFSVPVSINATISASAGVHTVDIRAKTTGGKLQSDSSALQVMAIER